MTLSYKEYQSYESYDEALRKLNVWLMQTPGQITIVQVKKEKFETLQNITFIIDIWYTRE